MMHASQVRGNMGTTEWSQPSKEEMKGWEERREETSEPGRESNWQEKKKNWKISTD